ncbi:MAG: hypothetical protein U9N87_09810, partial [Planctomycetota bacterium]|nr:hypothetical protein [Planctomycetota bacterium]
MSWPQTSRAVAFTVNYDSGQSDAPSYDSSGDGLVDMVEAAAAMYSDIFEDTESITIHCWWEDLPDNVKGGHELVDQNGDGTMVMQGGKYTAPKFFQAAELVVETDVSTISSRSVFLGQGKSNLSADLRLEQSALIVAGAQFAGDGDLIIATGCQLNIEDGATIGVDLVSEGRISPGSSPGHAAIDGDLTMIGGSLEIEIDLVALAAGSDRLSITGQAALDGNLVIVETVYAPLNIGDSLTIMIFGSRSGVFSSITQNPSGSNPSLACIYGTNDIILRATLPGDINLDDRVDDLD